MTAVLFSKMFPSKHGRIDVFYEKYWNPGFAKPLWRYGFQSKNGSVHVVKDHLLSRPKLKERTLYKAN